ncbi:hypothetical protein NQ317_012404 [Molorchus minor]|uniref:Uncharacterized protein n=1 Tax=Molorchus minor TaxID=1323400 RepID=A0ABQ9JJW5_9CUCU|nr:hypothetical protein NQ317_012404 [Molorchus minor]
MLPLRYTRNLFLRSFCIVYLSAFLSFYIQIPGLYGDNGVLPAKAVLENSKHNTLSAKVHYQPTLLWLAPYLGLDTNYALDVLALLGAFLAFTGWCHRNFVLSPYLPDCGHYTSHSIKLAKHLLHRVLEETVEEFKNEVDKEITDMKKDFEVLIKQTKIDNGLVDVKKRNRHIETSASFIDGIRDCETQQALRLARCKKLNEVLAYALEFEAASKRQGGI